MRLRHPALTLHQNAALTRQRPARATMSKRARRLEEQQHPASLERRLGGTN
jgi:hypothetical protein